MKVEIKIAYWLLIFLALGLDYYAFVIRESHYGLYLGLPLIILSIFLLFYDSAKDSRRYL